MSRSAFLIGSVWGRPATLRSLLRAAGWKKRSIRGKGRGIHVAVDSGAEGWRALGVAPDLAVGDWDSLRDSRAIHGARRVTLERAKDRSDLWHAAVEALRAGAKDLICFGVTGGRPDHHLATLLDLGRIASGEGGPVRSVRALGPEGEYVFIAASRASTTWRRRLKRGRTVSIFALGGPARGVTLKGFEFPLRRATLVSGSRGLSNVATARVCEIRVSRGQVVAILPTERGAR